MRRCFFNKQTSDEEEMVVTEQQSAERPHHATLPPEFTAIRTWIAPRSVWIAPRHSGTPRGFRGAWGQCRPPEIGKAAWAHFRVPPRVSMSRRAASCRPLCARATQIRLSPGFKRDRGPFNWRHAQHPSPVLDHRPVPCYGITTACGATTQPLCTMLCTPYHHSPEPDTAR